jgi:tetratricopeptide (TPR) repeat protein
MKSPADINQLFGAAEAAYAQGNGAAALKLIAQIEPLISPHSGLLHLKGLAQISEGDLQQASINLTSASQLAPNDFQISNNLANLLCDLNQYDAALAQYGNAINANPNFHDARLNRAISLQKLGRYDEARADFEILVSLSPGVSRFWSAKAAMEIDCGDWDTAKANFGQALKIDPKNIVALAGLGKIALETGEEQSSAYYQAAHDLNTGNLSLVIGLAHAKSQNGDPGAADILKPYLARFPAWTEGHEVYAHIQYEQADNADSASLFDAAVTDNPNNDDLRLSLCRTMAGQDKYAEALTILSNRPNSLPDSLPVSSMAVSLALAMGDDNLAHNLIAKLPEDDDTSCLRARLHLKRKEIGQAEHVLAKLRQKEPHNIAAWAYSDIGWRISGDERHHWLHGQSSLFNEQMLELSVTELHEISEYLRLLHVSSSAPIGQSLRGGTQTRGRLLRRSHPAISKLKSAIEIAVQKHWDDMPDMDPKHPLLLHRRKRPTIDGSWSVRLTGQGFHINHFHPLGVLSSACYIVVPDECADAVHKPGWLELGRAPAELGIDLEALVSIQPAPGKIVLFPSTLFHGTRKFGNGERLSVAFDVQAR